MIPNKSEASLKKGNWFIYNDGMNAIQVWGSNLNGKEKIYLNNELVSEQRSVKMQSSHNFKDNDGQHYEVKFKTESLLKGALECTIKKEDTVLKVFKTRYIKGKNFTLKRFLILILASAIFGFTIATYKLPDFTLIIFLLLVLIIHFKTRDNGEIIIEE
jgi:hypothetical protein